MDGGDMSWLSEQHTYTRWREDFARSLAGQFHLFEQNNIFLSHKNELAVVAKRVDEYVRNGELKENCPLITLFFEEPWPTQCIQMIVIVLRDDGYVYFGRDEAFATLGLGGRFKDGQFEFYAQYKDELDAY